MMHDFSDKSTDLLDVMGIPDIMGTLAGPARGGAGICISKTKPDGVCVRQISPIICMIVLLLVCFGAPATGQEVAVGGRPAVESDSGAARQLRICEEALLRGSTDRSRTDAAIELLRREDDAAWEVLMKALLSTDNAAARQAVCRGLVVSRSWPEHTRSRKVFLEPLLGILIDESSADARLAAEALLVFRYAEIGDRLGRLARMSDLDRGVRLNVIHALRLWPDKEAILELVNLLDDADAEVAGAAAAALPYWVEAGADKEAILEELQRKSPDEIIKARLEGMQQQMARLEAQRELWKKLYLGALDREFEKSDEDGKGRMLAERLASEYAAVRLWAVNKAKAFTGPRPKTFRENLLALVSDKDWEIRLATARALANMSALDPAAALLAQLKVETYSDVRLAIFDALGEACFFAFSPGSPIALDESIRTETLAIAAQYVQDKDARVAAQGAAVMGKLLELNNVQSEVVGEYLALLAGRYQQAKGSTGMLRGELLGVMARLCGDGDHRQKAAGVFRQFFLEGLAAGDDNTVREAAATGLMNIDKAAAFRLFKDSGLANDDSPVVRRVVMRLAGELGTAEDVVWLAERINDNGEAETAWKAMRDILLRADAKTVYEWAKKVASGEDRFNHARDLLDAAEKKAEGQKDAALLRAVRTDLCDWYAQRGDYGKAIAYCDLLLAQTTDSSERERLQLRLLEAYLQTADAAKAASVVAERLALRDMGAEDAFAAKIGAFLGLRDVNPGAKTAVVEALGQIKAPAARPRWTAQLGMWRQMVATPALPPEASASASASPGVNK